MKYLIYFKNRSRSLNVSVLFKIYDAIFAVRYPGKNARVVSVINKLNIAEKPTLKMVQVKPTKQNIKNSCDKSNDLSFSGFVFLYSSQGVKAFCRTMNALSAIPARGVSE